MASWHLLGGVLEKLTIPSEVVGRREAVGHRHGLDARNARRSVRPVRFLRLPLIELAMADSRLNRLIHYLCALNVMKRSMTQPFSWIPPAKRFVNWVIVVFS